MREDWFIASPPSKGAGIYEWRIEGVGVYVGQAKRLAARMRAYPNNVRKLLEGRPWRKSADRPFRDVHYALRDAHEAGASVTFSILENCPPELLNERERYWIDRRREEIAGTGLKLFNSN